MGVIDKWFSKNMDFIFKNQSTAGELLFKKISHFAKTLNEK